MAEEGAAGEPAAQTDAIREQAYRRVRDREPLQNHAGGLIIVRCMKHEPISLGKLSRQLLIARTDKRAGSKFAVGWTLVRYVDWISDMISGLGWVAGMEPDTHDERLPELVGVSRGQAVHTIRMASDGRYVHAYPVEDA